MSATVSGQEGGEKGGGGRGGTECFLEKNSLSFKVWCNLSAASVRSFLSKDRFKGTKLRPSDNKS